jgi:hypothetical protein
MVDLDFDTPLERLSAGNTSLFAENQRHWNVDAFFRELWCRFIKNQYRRAFTLLYPPEDPKDMI